MSFCGHCGARAAPEASYCPKCGNALARQAASAPPSPSSEAPASIAQPTPPPQAGPAAVAQREAQRAPAPPPTHPRAPPDRPQPRSLPSSGYEPPSGHSGNRVPVAAIVAVVVLVAALGAGAALLLSRNTSTHHRSADHTSASAEAPTDESSTVPVANEAAAATSQAAVMALLASYQTAYSNHDAAGLSQLFAPGVVRHGLTASGCRTSTGRAAVLADYESQFADGSGTYHLVGLTTSDVELRGTDAAHVNSHYKITPGGSGYVSFTFAREGNEWKMSQVYATCS